MIPTPKTIAQRLRVPMETARIVRRMMENHERSGAPFATETIESIGDALSAGGFATYGAEFIGRGDGPRSPSIEYLNTGDTYDATILYLDGVTESGRSTGCGRWAVGSWGDIVERGRYQ
jgi:hypothetical protein